MKKNESGLSLVELLAVLVLISLVTGIIWTSMSVSMRHNVVETTKLQLQQEANTVITKIQQEHRKRICYQIIINKNSIELIDCVTKSKYLEIESEKLLYGPDMNEVIEPKQEDLNLEGFYVKTVDNKMIVEIPTIITRFKSER
ncbi:prepilin-type N-terminal cleavage/methylation domain-containing protein [Sporosarcina gallistercoris]|uniref:prepilin-type N-terminal cleavage/methylation domain-containing protein n=1 Tax=Sporosarcina gallistercoris TaxID=2762245 RepID=UPI003D290B62